MTSRARSYRFAIATIAAGFVTLGVTARPLAVQQTTTTATDPVFEQSIDELQAALTSGKVTSVQLVDGYTTRITRYDVGGPRVNAIIALNPNARAAAAALDRERAAGHVRGPLHGIPIVIKDNYDTADMPTTGGSIALATSQPARDAFQVAKLKGAGAIILAKANLQELAAGIVTVSSLSGQTKNPYDLTRNPGGSSGGTGAAVAASFAAAGMGTDTCGSIRIPSSHNNLTGLRPTRGLSSRGGVIPLSHTQDVAGPIARSVRDVARLLDATVGADPEDAVTQLGAGHIPRSYVDGLAAATLKGTRVGVLKELFGDTPDDAEVTNIVNAATSRMRAAGAEVVDIAVPGLAELMRSSSVIDAEFKFDLADYLVAHSGSPVKSLGDIMSLGLYHVDLDVNFRRRNAMVSRDTDTYRASLAKQRELADAMLAAMDAAKVSFVVYPPIRRKAALIGEPQPGGNNCQLSASTGFPALVVPAGFTPDGLPVGIEMLGRPWSEHELLSAGLALEQSSPQRKAPASAPPLATSALLLTGATMVMAPARATGALDQSAVALTADFTWNATTRALDYHVTMTGDPRDVILLALHRGDAGGNGPIVAPLTRRGARTMNGRVTLRESDRAAVESGVGYIEIYTRARPLGAARVTVKISAR